MKLLMIVIIVSFSFSARSQVSRRLDSLEKAEQICLDKGIRMTDCARKYYFQMDSILNVEYSAQRNRLIGDSAKNIFKADQLKWLRGRDVYFKKVEMDYDNKIKSGEWGKDDIMIVFQQKADYVRKRILVIANSK